MKQAGIARFAKRLVDVAVAGAGLVTAAPVLVGAAVALRLESRGPVFFRQRRPGLNGRPFEIIKFRTMREAIDARGVPLPDKDRLTSVGRFLRSTSIDELPQLWNVLRGDLSLVGPRPLLMRYMERYSPAQARRHAVLPGITGWAQINGRNAISWDKKFELDVWYVDHWSPLLDLRILAETGLRVLRRDGISQAGHATMPEFMGTEVDR